MLIKNEFILPIKFFCYIKVEQLIKKLLLNIQILGFKNKNVYEFLNIKWFGDFRNFYEFCQKSNFIKLIINTVAIDF